MGDLSFGDFRVAVAGMNGRNPWLIEKGEKKTRSALTDYNPINYKIIHHVCRQDHNASSIVRAASPADTTIEEKPTPRSNLYNDDPRAAIKKAIEE